MIKPIYVVFLLFSGLFLSACLTDIEEEVIRQQILDNGQMIRDAFSTGDLEKIESLHHPEVIKALAYQDVKEGREAVMQGLEETLSAYSLEFIENEVENMLIQKDLVIEQTKFSIKGTPKEGGESFIFSGRTMVTYVRYADSPTGWATIREIIQPATD